MSLCAYVSGKLIHSLVVLVQVTRAIVPGITLVLSIWIMGATFTRFQVRFAITAARR